MKHRSALTGLLALTLVLSCGSGAGDVASVLVVSSVDVQPGITNVVLGQTLQLNATPKTSSGITVPGRGVTWSSTDPLIASVSNSGVVTGIALGGPVRVRATVDGVVGDALVTVRPVPIDRITVLPANSGVLVAGGVQLTATAFDAAGTELPGRSFLWESSAPAIAAVTTTGIVIGLAQGGPVTISAIAEGKTGSALVSVSTRPATRLAFAQQPGPGIAGVALAPAIQIALQDDLLSTVVGAANPVTISLAGNPGGATLGGSTTINATSGIATFGNLTLSKPGTGYTFLVTSPGLVAATSTPFNVTVGAASKLAFTTALPASAQSGVAFGPQPVLQLQDAVGNPVPQSGVVVTATIASGAGTLGGGTTATTNSAGVAAFSNLSLSGAAGTYTVSFTAPGIAAAVSGPVTLGSGVAQSLQISIQPTSSAQSGVPLSQQPAIQLKDAAGNNAAQAGVVITAAIASGGGTLGGATTATTNVNGLAQFASLAINGPAGSYTLGFSAPGIAGATSSPIVLGAGAPTQLAMVTQPSATASSGAAFAQQPSVRLRDGGGNPVAIAGVQITAAITSGTGTLLGTATASTVATGIATFTNLGISGTAGPYTLTFTSSGLTSVISTTITLSAGSANNLGLTTQPSAGGTSGVAFAQQPVVQIRDAALNPVAQSGVVVTAAIASGPGGATLAGNTATTAGTGAATFTTLRITGPSGTYTLQFTAPSLTAVTSGGITLGAGAPTTIAANSVTSQSAPASTAVAAPPSVKVTDGSGNAVAGVAVTFAVTAGGGTVVPAGPSTVATNASGIATATSWTLGPAAGTNNNTVTATVAGLTGSPVTFTASASAGGATTIAANSVTSQNATVGTAVAAPPSVKVTDAGNNPVAGVAVTFAVVTGGGSVVPAGPTTVATNASGIATATSWTLGTTAGTNNNSVTATASGLSGSPVTFTASGVAGAANTIAANSVTTQSAAVGTAVGAPPSVKVTDANGNPKSAVAVTFTVTAGGGSSNPASPATINTDAAGVATLTSWTLGNSAGTNTVTASATVPNGSPVTFNATGTAAAAHSITANSSQNQSATVGTNVAAPPSVKVSDINGNGVQGVSVAFAVNSGGGSIVPASPAIVISDASGFATLTSWTLGTTAGPNSVSASASVSTGSPVTFNATGTAGAANTIAANSVTTQSAAVGTAVGAPPSVKVTDANGNPKAAVAVTFTVTAGGGSSNPASPATINTDAAGVATLTSWTLGNSAGTNTVTASATVPNGSPVTFNATATAAGAHSIAANSTTTQSATVGTNVGAPPSVKVSDINGNGVQGVAVAFVVTAGGGSSNPASPAGVNTDANGIASLTSWTLGTAAGTNTVTASASVTTGSPVTFTATGTAAAANTIAANSAISQSATAGTAVAAPPSVLVTDVHGNPKSGVAVTFAVTAGGGTVVPAGPATVSTDVNGIATATSWTLGPTAGTNNNTVTASAAVPSGSPVTFTASATTGSANTIAANSATSQSATVGSAVAAPPSVLVTDAGGNPKSGVAVTFAVTAGGGTVVPAGPTTVATDANGIATATSWTLGTTAGTNNNTVTASAAVPNGSPVTFTASGLAGPANTIAANSATSQSANVGTAVSAPPSVLVTDANGNPKSNVAVTFTLTAGAGTLNPASPAVINTGVNGVATLTSWTLGPSAGSNNNTVEATASVPNGSPVTFTASGTSAGATHLNITTQPSATAQSGVAFAQQPVIQLADAGNNPVTQQGVMVTAAIASGTGTLSGTTAVATDANGTATFTDLVITGTTGNHTLGFTATSLTGATSGTINITAGVPASFIFDTDPSANATNGVAFSTQPVVRVHDGSGNNVPNVLVTATITGAPAGASLIGGTTATTAPNGRASFSGLGLTGPVGSYTLTFTAGAASSGPSTSIALAEGAAAIIAANSATSQSATVGTAVGAPPSVKVTDTGGNPIQNVNVTFTLTAGGGTQNPASPAIVPTDGSGVATLTSWTLGTTAGTNNNTVQAASGSLSGSPVTFTASGTAGAATQLTITQEPSTTAQNNVPFPQQPILLLRDAFNNPVSNISVTASITGSPGGVSLIGTVTVSTDASGVATFSGLGLAGTLGSYTLTFTANALTATSTSILLIP